MPVAYARVTIDDVNEAAYSDTQNIRGLLEKIQTKFNDAASTAEITLQELQVDEDGNETWLTVATYTAADNDSWQPVTGTTLVNGDAGTGESQIPVRSENGWRIQVTDADDVGSVDVWVSFKQG